MAEEVKRVRIRHRDTGTLLAEGPVGWGITPFEGNLYIARKYLKTDRFRGPGPMHLQVSLCLDGPASRSRAARKKRCIDVLVAEPFATVHLAS